MRLSEGSSRFSRRSSGQVRRSGKKIVGPVIKTRTRDGQQLTLTDLVDDLSKIEPQMAHHLGKGHQFLQTLNF